MSTLPLTAIQLAGWDNPEDALGKMINWSIGSLNLQKGKDHPDNRKIKARDLKT